MDNIALKSRVLLVVLASFLIGIPFSGHAESLTAMSGKSKFLQFNLSNLQKKRATSVYASQDHNCPSHYYYAHGSATPNDLPNLWKRKTRSQMGKAGFTKGVIKRCVNSGAFVVRNLELQRHSKNSKYDNVLVPGVLVRQKTGEFSETVEPVMVETWVNNKGNKHRVLFGDLKTFCTVVVKGSNFNGSCPGMGKLSGRAVKSQGRWSLRSENAKGKFAIFTNYTEARARREF